MRDVRFYWMVALAALVASTGGAMAQDIGVFVSSTATDGNIGGLAGADGICQGLGASAFPGSGPWVAWLSDSTMDARDRIPTPGAGGAYVRAAETSTVIASDLLDLTDGTLTNSVRLTETGAVLETGMWTGTRADGTGAADCVGWMSNTANDFGKTGNSGAVDATWTEASDEDCESEILNIYCFGAPVPVPTLPLSALIALSVLLLAGGAYLYRRRQLAG